MKPTDFNAFSETISLVAEQYGKPMSPNLLQLYFDSLADQPLEDVRRALAAHVRDTAAGQFMPKIADVLRICENFGEAKDGHPGPEEAWALVAAGLNNEGLTVVWTEEIAQAFGVALHLQGDPVAARMAFKENYTVALAHARHAGKPARWSPSLGWDAAGREGVLLEAVRQGRLGAAHVKQLLPYLEGGGSEELQVMVDKTAKKLLGRAA